MDPRYTGIEKNVSVVRFLPVPTEVKGQTHREFSRAWVRMVGPDVLAVEKKKS